MSYESSTSSALPDGETRTNLIINYLPQTLTDQEFYKIFVVVGPIKNCRIMKDLKTGYSFGFGFVEYQKPEDAAKAILQLNNLPVQHKRIKVSYARPPGEDIKETNLYIQNIPRSYTLDQLEELFAVYGQIVQKNLLKDKVTGLPRGVGFVRFDKKSQAEAAIVGMNGVVPEGGTEPLVVKVAEEHGKMKAAYYAGYHAGLSNTRGGTSGRGRGNYNNRGAAGYQGRGNYNNMLGSTNPNVTSLVSVLRATPLLKSDPDMPDFNRQYQQGGKMAADRTANRYNPIGSGGGYAGGYGGGGSGADYTNHAAGQQSSFYSFSTPSFSGGNYTSFSGMSNNNSGSNSGYARY
ncbi:sex-lethal homolog isoform X2 [Homarus americanus]|uniref:sex-lethal homolog isoform X2 n=1 Tax=Homarus americanus TaxID=6706 RepID=UPI001C4852C8|nr:sex-lethal homolog isoform X2 [Homarus americanus]